MIEVPFNVPPVLGEEIGAIEDVVRRRKLSGDGAYTKACESWLEARYGCHAALLTHSCTAALEMAALLLELAPGDEVILPTFTFTSTANAVVLRGATPVFADVDIGTMNISVDAIERLITPATKAIWVIHYAGRPPDMHRINDIASAHRIAVVEDAAQALGSSYHGQPAGSHSCMSTISFHETKNIVSGEGGALIINDARYKDRAEIIREKGTNRRAFLEGLTDKYTWVDLGSSYLPSELVAAYLQPQLEATDQVSAARSQLWHRYRARLQSALEHGVTLPDPVPVDTVINGHLFHMLLPQAEMRSRFIAGMRQRGVQSPFHYLPLHSAPAGLRFGKAPAGCPVAEDAAARLVRLPLYYGLTDEAFDHVISSVMETLAECRA